MIAALIDVTIDEVVLRGVPPEHAHQVVAHLEARLRTLALGSSAGSDAPLDVPSDDWRDRAESSRRLPDVEAPASSAAALGRSVAEAIWSEVAGHRRTNGTART